MTTYQEIYDRFLNKITSYMIFDMSDSEATQYCHGLMLSAIANMQNFEHDYNDYDESEECFNSILTNIEIECLAIQMVCEWVDPQLNNTALTRQYIGTSEEKLRVNSTHSSLHLETLQCIPSYMLERP